MPEDAGLRRTEKLCPSSQIKEKNQEMRLDFSPLPNSSLGCILDTKFSSKTKHCCSRSMKAQEKHF